MAKKFTDDYTLGELLGTGNFSKVFDGVNKKTKKTMAIKIMEKSKMETARVKTEIEIMRKVKHKNIINMEAVYEDDEKMYIVMEKVTGGELFNKIVEIGSYSE